MAWRARAECDGRNRADAAPVPPGESFDYVFTPPDAGTFWYHSGFRPEVQVDRGLYGPLIVEEPIMPDLDELLLTIDDWLIDSSGRVDEKSRGDLLRRPMRGGSATG